MAFQAMDGGSTPLARSPSDSSGRLLPTLKTIERERARELRSAEGRAIKEIARLLGVAPSSVSRWVRDIELTPEQHEALRQRNPAYNGQRAGQASRSAYALERRKTYQQDGRALARRGDALHAAGCMLYWGEGWKTRDKVQLANSDPEVMRLFLAFLRTYFDVPDEKVRVRCYLYADHVERQRETEAFWLSLLGLPASCLTRSAVNVYSKHSQRKRLNVLPYGTCRVTVNSTRIVQSIYGSIQEYAGFEREEWLW
jgi:transposase-like protein